jgi:hypothetical protein
MALIKCRFYWAVNVGALSPLITVNVETHVSFWAAYLIPLVYVCPGPSSQSLDHSLTFSRVIVIAAAVFISGGKRFVKTPPHGSAVIDAVKIVTIAVKEGGFENARPSALQARGALERHRFAESPNFTDKAVKDVQSGITACKVCVEPQDGVGAYANRCFDSSSYSCHSTSSAGSRSGTTSSRKPGLWRCTALQTICFRILIRLP